MAGMPYEAELLAKRSSSLYTNASVLWLVFIGAGSFLGVVWGCAAAQAAGPMFYGLVFSAVLLPCILGAVLTAAATVSLLQTIALRGLREAVLDLSRRERVPSAE